MTIKYTTVRLQRKEALLGVTYPKGALFIRGNDFSSYVLNVQRILLIFR